MISKIPSDMKVGERLTLISYGLGKDPVILSMISIHTQDTVSVNRCTVGETHLELRYPDTPKRETGLEIPAINTPKS